MDRKYQYLTPLAQKVLKGHGTHNALRKLRWGFRQSVHSITAAPTSEKDEWTGEVFRAASCQRDAIMEVIAMARRTIFVAFGLSLLLVSLTILTRSHIKKQPLLVNAAVQQSQADPSGIPPGLWIEYDPLEERYTYCYYNSGLRSCSHDFITREHAIRDAQLFEKYLKRTR